MQRWDEMKCTTPLPGPIRLMRLRATITDRYEQSIGRRKSPTATYIYLLHPPSSLATMTSASYHRVATSPTTDPIPLALRSNFAPSNIAFASAPWQPRDTSRVRDPHEIPRCSSYFASSVAGSGTRLRLYACLTYATICCLAHAPSHAEECWLGQEIAVDVDQVELFCCACGDQVYDGELDKVVVLA